MNINYLNVHKSKSFPCLHNSFKKLTQQYFSVVVRAVPPEEIGRGSFATMSSFLFHSCYLNTWTHHVSASSPYKKELSFLQLAPRGAPWLSQ